MCELVEEPGLKPVIRSRAEGEVLGTCARGLVQLKEVSPVVMSLDRPMMRLMVDGRALMGPTFSCFFSSLSFALLPASRSHLELLSAWSSYSIALSFPNHIYSLILGC